MKPKIVAPEITYIVSAYSRPNLLPCCLWSLKGQSHERFEVIVTDNAIDEKIALQHQHAVLAMKDKRFRYCRTAKKIKVSDCYWAAEYAIKHLARGLWYAFPCDDSYYAPEYGRRMLTAAHMNDWDFIICGQVVVGPEAAGGSGYRIWEMKPGKAIKTSFMVRADVFPGFAGKPLVSGAMAADYAFSSEISQVVRWGIVNECMVVHN